jgi:hypothetical protein
MIPILVKGKLFLGLSRVARRLNVNVFDLSVGVRRGPTELVNRMRTGSGSVLPSQTNHIHIHGERASLALCDRQWSPGPNIDVEMNCIKVREVLSMISIRLRHETAPWQRENCRRQCSPTRVPCPSEGKVVPSYGELLNV